MKKFDRTLLVGETPTDLKSYWKLILSKCERHVFSEENIEKIADTLNIFVIDYYHHENPNLSELVCSSVAASKIDLWYSWNEIDKYLPLSYTGNDLQYILNNESF